MIANAVALLIVAVAATYTTWKLMPQATRRRIAARLTRAAQRNARLSSQQAARIELRLVGKACGGCDTCGGCSDGRRSRG